MKNQADLGSTPAGRARAVQAVLIAVAGCASGAGSTSGAAQNSDDGPRAVAAPAAAMPADANTAVPARFDAGASAPPQRLRNDLPALHGFARRVAAQAARFPDAFFLSAPRRGAGVALTFDDGPNPASTDKILAILADHDAPATFFVLGSGARRFPAIVRRIAAAGHAIGSHGYSHDYFTDLEPAPAFAAHIDKTGQILNHLIGTTPRIYRPPYGKVSDEQIRYFAARGFVAVNWSVDSCDWMADHNQTAQIVATVMDNVHDGAIILFHSNRLRTTTRAALPHIITELRRRGHVLRTVPELLALEEAR